MNGHALLSTAGSERQADPPRAAFLFASQGDCRRVTRPAVIGLARTVSGNGPSGRSNPPGPAAPVREGALPAPTRRRRPRRPTPTLLRLHGRLESPMRAFAGSFAMGLMMLFGGYGLIA